MLFISWSKYKVILWSGFKVVYMILKLTRILKNLNNDIMYIIRCINFKSCLYQLGIVYVFLFRLKCFLHHKASLISKTNKFGSCFDLYKRVFLSICRSKNQ
jgi:hypothetical protein